MKLTLHRIICWASCAFGLVSGLGTLCAATSQEVLQERTAWFEAFNASKALFVSGDFQRAEKTLLDANRNKPGTPEWHIESASALVRMAFSVREPDGADLSVMIAQDALSQLAQAEQKLKLPADAKLATTVKAMAGLISEELAGTSEMAKNYYRAAAQLNPDSPSLAAKVKQFADADAAVQAKQKKGGG